MQTNENIKLKPVPIRIAFTKTGSLQFISHLDLMRTMTRLIVRADINVYYTEGFNPKPKLVFALPLSVGTESEIELLDIKVYDQEPDLVKIRNNLKREEVPGIKILDAYIPKTKFRDIAFSEYEIKLRSKALKASDTERINGMVNGPVIVYKRSKSGEGDYDISSWIKSLSADGEDGEITVKATLTADPEHFLNPEYIVTAIKNLIGYEDDIAPGGDGYSIKRVAVYGANMKKFR